MQMLPIPMGTAQRGARVCLVARCLGEPGISSPMWFGVSKILWVVQSTGKIGALRAGVEIVRLWGSAATDVFGVLLERG